MSISAAGESQAFRWDMVNGMVGLGHLSEEILSSTARGVSFDGSIIVGDSWYLDPVGGPSTAAFIWDAEGGMRDLGHLDARWATGVSGDGSTVVGFRDHGQSYEGFVWDEVTGMRGLGFLPGGVYGWAHAVSSNGSVVVGFSQHQSSGTIEAYRWTEEGGMVGLGDLPGYDSSNAIHLTPDGSSVVGSVSTGDMFATYYAEAFVWDAAGGMRGLGHLPGDDGSTAAGISADGSIIVGVSSFGSMHRAFIWDEINEMRDLKSVLEDDYGLDLAGWQLSIAFGISHDGLRIAGTGINPEGLTEAWVAVIPEPAATGVVGLIALALRRRRRCDGSTVLQSCGRIEPAPHSTCETLTASRGGSFRSRT